jgi:hypothetical protein
MVQPEALSSGSVIEAIQRKLVDLPPQNDASVGLRRWCSS